MAPGKGFPTAAKRAERGGEALSCVTGAGRRPVELGSCGKFKRRHKKGRGEITLGTNVENYQSPNKSSTIQEGILAKGSSKRKTQPVPLKTGPSKGHVAKSVIRDDSGGGGNTKKRW